MAEQGLLDFLDQLELKLGEASDALPAAPEEASEKVWDARSIAAQMRILIDRRRRTGEFEKLG